MAILKYQRCILVAKHKNSWNPMRAVKIQYIQFVVIVTVIRLNSQSSHAVRSYVLKQIYRARVLRTVLMNSFLFLTQLVIISGFYIVIPCITFNLTGKKI